MTISSDHLRVILLVGADARLLDTRERVLKSAGYLVRSALSVDEALNLSLAGDFDLMLICHSLSPTDSNHLVSVIRNAGSAIPVISIAALHGKVAPAFADGVAGSGPEELLLAIKAWEESEAEKFRLFGIEKMQ